MGLLLPACLPNCLVSEEGTTKLKNPRICEAEQHLFMWTMKAYILSILIVVIQCLCSFCVENSNVIENIIHATLYFEITEHVGEHCQEETEKYRTHSFRYFKVDCRAKDSIFLKTWLDCILQFPLLDTKDVTNYRQMTEMCG